MNTKDNMPEMLKIYRAKVSISGGTALHFINIDHEAKGRVRFHFVRPMYSLNDYEVYMPPGVTSPSFKDQIRALNRAYVVTAIPPEQYEAQIRLLLKEAYGETATIIIDEINETS